MKTDTAFTDAVEVLRSKHGNHSKAAAAIGITPQHYRFVRGRGQPGATLRKLVIALASQPEGPAHDAA